MNAKERKQTLHDAAIALEVTRNKFREFCHQHGVRDAAWGYHPRSKKFARAWREFMRDEAMPWNRKARDLIVQTLDPVEPPTQPVQEFLAYMGAWEELLSRWEAGVSLGQHHVNINFPSFLGMHLDSLGRGEEGTTYQ